MDEGAAQLFTKEDNVAQDHRHGGAFTCGDSIPPGTLNMVLHDEPLALHHYEV